MKSIYAVSCPRGTFISQSASSGCQTCPNGTYSEEINSTECLKCDECRAGKHHRVTKACTPTSNTQCKCDPGYYYLDVFLLCMKCQTCRKGRGVVRNCTEKSNTVCEPCKKRKTYSDKKDFNRCSPCLKCENGDIVKFCKRRSNTVCANAEVRNHTEHNWLVTTTITSRTTSPTSPTQRKFTYKRGTPSSSRNSTERINHWTQPTVQRIAIAGNGNTKSYRIALFTLVGVAGFASMVLIAALRYFWRHRQKFQKPDTENGEAPTKSTKV